MDDVNQAYQILGVTASMSLEEIEIVYEELLQKYTDLANDNMYYKEKLQQWEEAFECIVDHRLEIEEIEEVYSNQRPKTIFLIIAKVVIVIIVTLSIVNEIGWLEKFRSKPTTYTESTTVYDLSNNFKLSLSKFSEFDEWDWGYYEEGGQWIIILAIKVDEANEEGAFINAYNFRLGNDYPTTMVSTDIYSDEDLNQVHYLGGYSELVPLNQKFGIVFEVQSFEQGEERILYYNHPDGTQHEVGRLIFDVLNDTEDHGIFI